MRLGALLALGLFVLGCSDKGATEDSKTADDVDPCVKSSARTVGSAAKAGGTTAVEGIKTLGDSIGGLVEGGKDEAKRRWDKGKQETKTTANAGGQETKAAANANDCD